MSRQARSEAPPHAPPPVERTAAGFVEAFRDFWSAPSLERMGELLRDDVVLVQPLSPPMHGLDESRRGFATIFAWLPDLRAEVDRWSASGEVVFIEFRLRATIGGRPFEWPAVDRFVLDECGMARERISYFDPFPLLGAALTRPSGWLRLVRSGAAASLFRGGRRASPASGTRPISGLSRHEAS
ncbi:MAG: nuclear transport factor 2 family protein [Candidatus Binatia bacterium]